jgi:uncharacterized protein YjbI with pentapeptide repeats
MDWILVHHEAIRNIGLVVAAAIGLPVAFWRSRIANKTLLAETYTKAIDQIGDEKEAIKLGGLYALEKIARDNRQYHGQIIEVLCAFVRLHAPLDIEIEEMNDEEMRTQENNAKKPKLTVQAALTIIGRRNASFEHVSKLRTLRNRFNSRFNQFLGSYILPENKQDRVFLDFSSTNLEGANFDNANLELSDFSNANLKKAFFWGADLEMATLSKVNLSFANLSCANLRSAGISSANLEGAFLRNSNLEYAELLTSNLKDAHLEKANLKKTNFEGAVLTTANLDYANLEEADLEEANLEGAILEGANLKKANLQGANLRAANLEGAILDEAILEYANFKDTSIDESFFNYAQGAGKNLLKVNLKEAICINRTKQEHIEKSLNHLIKIKHSKK